MFGAVFLSILAGITERWVERQPNGLRLQASGQPKILSRIGTSLLSLIGILCVILVFCQHPEILMKSWKTQCSMSGVSKSLCFSS